VNSDFWALAVILFNLLTNQPLYHFPHIHDACFGYFILAEGLSSTRRNDRLEQVFSMVAERARATGIERPLNDLKARVQATLRLDTSSVELLEHLLAIDPRDRWSLAQAFEYLLRMG
jgi:serine/threonine protein kinase